MPRITVERRHLVTKRRPCDIKDLVEYLCVRDHDL